MIAAEKGFHRCLRHLLSFGADISYRRVDLPLLHFPSCDPAEQHERTALDLATRNKRTKCIDLLKSYTVSASLICPAPLLSLPMSHLPC
jgi:hypothetical protein